MAGSGVDFRGEDLEETMESQLEPTGEDIPGLHDGSDNQVEKIVLDNLRHACNGSTWSGRKHQTQRVPDELAVRTSRR